MNAQQELCPLCGEGHVTARVQYEEQTYKGHTELIALHLNECDHCSSEFSGAAETRLNKRALMAFRKRVDGLLTGAEIVAFRDQYNLTQAQAARLFGGGPVAFSKYENDDVVQSEAMDTLLRLVRRSTDAFWTLVDEKGMSQEFVSYKKVASPEAERPTLRRVFSKGEDPSPYYEPKKFRRFQSAGEQQWKK